MDNRHKMDGSGTHGGKGVETCSRDTQIVNRRRRVAGCPRMDIQNLNDQIQCVAARYRESNMCDGCASTHSYTINSSLRSCRVRIQHTKTGMWGPKSPICVVDLVLKSAQVDPAT